MPRWKCNATKHARQKNFLRNFYQGLIVDKQTWFFLFQSTLTRKRAVESDLLGVCVYLTLMRITSIGFQNASLSGPDREAGNENLWKPDSKMPRTWASATALNGKACWEGQSRRRAAFCDWKPLIVENEVEDKGSVWKKRFSETGVRRPESTHL